MRESPITFGPGAVDLILIGYQTMTRRVLHPQPPPLFNGDDQSTGVTTEYTTGDRLWVREDFYQLGHWRSRVYQPYDWGAHTQQEWVFVPSRAKISFAEPKQFRIRPDKISPELKQWYKRPAASMPKKYSRVTIVVNSVKIERLQDITPLGAFREGIIKEATDWSLDCDTPNPIHEYRKRWNAYGRDLWNKNPWTAVYSFSIAEKMRKGN